MVQELKEGDKVWIAQKPYGFGIKYNILRSENQVKAFEHGRHGPGWVVVPAVVTKAPQ